MITIVMRLWRAGSPVRLLNTLLPSFTTLILHDERSAENYLFFLSFHYDVEWGCLLEKETCYCVGLYPCITCDRILSWLSICTHVYCVCVRFMAMMSIWLELATMITHKSPSFMKNSWYELHALMRFSSLGHLNYTWSEPILRTN